MKRQGKTLNTVPAGSPRRLADGRNAWRKMDDSQRVQFVEWMASDEAPRLPSEVRAAVAFLAGILAGSLKR